MPQPSQNYLSSDGYIINQDNTAHIPYGRLTSDYSGCGWIAAFNLLRAAGKPADELTLSRQLATGWFRGAMGTGPFRLRRYLEGLGFQFATTGSRKQAALLAQNAPMGILMYVARHMGPHFVTFVEEDGAQKRFLNAEFGNSSLVTTMPEFLKKYARTPFCYLMVTI